MVGVLNSLSLWIINLGFYIRFRSQNRRKLMGVDLGDNTSWVSSKPLSYTKVPWVRVKGGGGQIYNTSYLRFIGI